MWFWNIYNTWKFYAGEVNEVIHPSIINITKISSNLFNDNDNDKISKITNNYKLYYWWSDLPVYKREYLIDFFNKINYNNIEYLHYDHLIYLNYLIIYHNFLILNITPLIKHEWSLESYNKFNQENLNILKKNNYGFSWISPKLFNSHKNYLINEGSFLLYHLDR
jgi:hypothetical protein